MTRRPDTTPGPVYYTTFQVAKKLGVSPPTVVNWVNSGLLAAHRTPGGHRRMKWEDIAAFAAKHRYPIDGVVPGEPEGGAAREARRALVVDDDPAFGLLVREFLTARGDWEVEVAHSGFAAGLLVARFKPAVVLMDLMMPDMDGFEVLRSFKNDPEMRGIPVVACTAYRDPAIEERVRREPFAGYVQKANKLDALLAAIELALTAGR